jgi:hypothetical protein
MALVTIAEMKAVLGVGNLYADADLQQVADSAIALVKAYVTDAAFTAEPAALQEAALSLAVDLWQSRITPGGQLNMADFTPGPQRGYRMIQKYAGLMGPYYDTGHMVG